MLSRRRPEHRSKETSTRPRRRTSAVKKLLSTEIHASGTPRTKQQTLTQIDFVKRIEPREDGLDLDDLEVEIAPRIKRRRLEELSPRRDNETIPSNVARASPRTRAAIRNAVAEETVASQPTGRDPLRRASTLLRTPKKQIRSEVPSSQSPLDSPLFASLRSTRTAALRSPLEDKSPNITARGRVTSARRDKSARTAPKLEIEDTYEKENDTQTSNRSRMSLREQEVKTEAGGAREGAQSRTTARSRCGKSPATARTVRMVIDDSDLEAEAEGYAEAEDGLTEMPAVADEGFSLDVDDPDAIRAPSSTVPKLNLQRTDSELIADQLTCELERSTQAMIPICVPSDSHQEERRWDLKRSQSENSRKLISQRSSRARTRQSISQATTVDITQVRTQTQANAGSQVHEFIHTQKPGSVMAPPWVFSSSPVEGIQGIQTWKGGILNDSQLLPDSILDYSLPRPPPWDSTQESLREE